MQNIACKINAPDAEQPDNAEHRFQTKRSQRRRTKKRIQSFSASTPLAPNNQGMQNIAFKINAPNAEHAENAERKIKYRFD